MGISLPAVVYLFKQTLKTRSAQLKVVDKRVDLLSEYKSAIVPKQLAHHLMPNRIADEILLAIRTIKLYAYEKLFAQRVFEHRAGEAAQLRLNLTFRVLSEGVL